MPNSFPGKLLVIFRTYLYTIIDAARKEGGAKKRPYITSSGDKDSDGESIADTAEQAEQQVHWCKHKQTIEKLKARSIPGQHHFYSQVYYHTFI